MVMPAEEMPSSSLEQSTLKLADSEVKIPLEISPSKSTEVSVTPNSVEMSETLRNITTFTRITELRFRMSRDVLVLSYMLSC